MKLTDAQQQAVTHSGHNLQLIACAGSGKTEVVARRVVHLLTPSPTGALAPRNVVALFGNRGQRPLRYAGSFFGGPARRAHRTALGAGGFRLRAESR
ncbi:MAG TPA: hypothetical protein DD490_16805 [Acidobacteria bacterium]|nr:hypothetical protein [Acidobacteriota bacterium]